MGKIYVLTAQEKKAISALLKLEKEWPKSLWLFSASGNLCVMRKDEDGNRITTSLGGMDQEAVLIAIDIENDGGDW